MQEFKTVEIDAGTTTPVPDGNQNDIVGASKILFVTPNGTKEISITTFMEYVRDHIANFIIAGDWLGKDYDDEANTLTLDSEMTQERVQDIVALFMVAGSGITRVYDDQANTLTLSADIPSRLPPSAMTTLWSNSAGYSTTGSLQLLNAGQNFTDYNYLFFYARDNHGRYYTSYLDRSTFYGNEHRMATDTGSIIVQWGHNSAFQLYHATEGHRLFSIRGV